MADDSLAFDLDQLRLRAEQQARNFDTFAKDIAQGRGPLLGEASRLAFAASEILVQAAQVDAGRQAVKRLAASVATVPTPICELPHESVEEEDACEQQRLRDLPPGEFGNLVRKINPTETPAVPGSAGGHR